MALYAWGTIEPAQNGNTKTYETIQSVMEHKGAKICFT
jgi:hypothetical protein